MGKYSATQEAVFSVFSTEAWLSENIKIFPSNFTGKVENSDYLRVTILSSDTGINLTSARGLLNIEIFTVKNKGPSSSNLLADTLDAYLQGKSIKVDAGVIQFSNSSLSPDGIDRDNSDLYRTLYTIPFNFFGES